MAWTTPGTAVAGAVLEADFWNSNVRDNTLHLYAQSQYPYRNLLYNGAMQIHQRGTSTASLTSGGYYTADRWNTLLSGAGTWTQSVENDAPTGSGLRKSLKMLCTTAQASPAAGAVGLIQQKLEGQDLQRIAKGTTSAQTLTLSFWVKANVTGTFIVAFYDNDNTRQVSKSYTISASGVWEQKQLSFPADATGQFDNDNAASLNVNFWLVAGSSFTSGTLATSWASNVDANTAVGQTNLAAATNNYLQVTGVQLEAGSVSTPFEFLPYGDELVRCQRYFRNWSSDYSHMCTFYNTTAAAAMIHLATPMRAAPNIAYTGTVSIDQPGSGAVNGTSIVGWNVGNTNAIGILVQGFTGRTAWSSGALMTAHSLSAEL